jgi:hypothetical protein
VEAEGAGWFMRPGGLARGSKTLQVRSRGSSLVDSCGWLTNPDLVARSVVVVATSSPSVCVSPSLSMALPLSVRFPCVSASLRALISSGALVFLAFLRRGLAGLCW